MTLCEVTTASDGKTGCRAGGVLTFDDGYADNLQQAAPLLVRHEIPATVFVTAGQLRRPNEFWWDELERLLLLPGMLPTVLSLGIDDSICRWELNGAAGFTEEDYQGYRGWHIEQPDDPTPRHKLYRSLYHLLHGMRDTERQAIIARLQTWANQGSIVARRIACSRGTKSFFWQGEA